MISNISSDNSYVYYLRVNMAALQARLLNVVNTFSFFTEKKLLNFKKHVSMVHTTIERSFSIKTINDIEVKETDLINEITNYRYTCVYSSFFSSQERKVNVERFDINYVRVGVGNHPVLLLPGALGNYKITIFY